MDIEKAFYKLLGSPEKFMKEIRLDCKKIEQLTDKNEAQLAELDHKIGELHDEKKAAERRRAEDEAIKRSSAEIVEAAKKQNSEADKKLNTLRAVLSEDTTKLDARSDKLDKKYLDLKKGEVRVEKKIKQLQAAEDAVAKSQAKYDQKLASLRTIVA